MKRAASETASEDDVQPSDRAPKSSGTATCWHGAQGWGRAAFSDPPPALELLAGALALPPRAFPCRGRGLSSSPLRLAPSPVAGSPFAVCACRPRGRSLPPSTTGAASCGAEQQPGGSCTFPVQMGTSTRRGQRRETWGWPAASITPCKHRVLLACGLLHPYAPFSIKGATSDRVRDLRMPSELVLQAFFFRFFRATNPSDNYLAGFSPSCEVSRCPPQPGCVAQARGVDKDPETKGLMQGTLLAPQRPPGDASCNLLSARGVTELPSILQDAAEASQGPTFCSKTS